ncbi:MAG: response regulator [Phycisphaerae bacterium]|jgi:PAS domain S-box-containing protein|nr:response regulator [Phycisphaerae bacterium]
MSDNGGAKTTILAVDDKPENLFILEKVITGHLPKCTILTAGSAAAGLSIADDTPLDAALIDVQMPYMDGIEMCRHLKANSATAHIPIILMTAHDASPTQKAIGLDSGADDFINKPIDNTELVARVAAVLRVKTAKDQLRRSAARLATLADHRTRQLADSENYYRSLIYNLHEDIIVIDENYSITDMNNSFLASVGRSAEDVIGNHCYEISHDFDKPCDQHDQECPLRKVFDTGLPHHCQHTHTGAGGVRIHVDILASPMKDKDGNVTHVVEAIRDITEQKNLEAQLRQAQKMEAIGRLAGGIAHDFRNQLTVITGYADWMLSHMDDDNEYTRYINQILDAAKRSTRLTGHLLAFSRREILAPRIAGPMTLIDSLVEPLKHMIGEDVVLVTSSGADDLDNITVDPGQFEHMLVNLAVNARDAMPKGGELRIDVAPAELDREFARRNIDALPGKYVAITVSDTGTGMDAETRRNAFDPFFTTKPVAEGTGLGLSIVHGFVRQSGGYVTIDSEVGHGTTFTIYLPTTTEQPEETESQDDIDDITGDRTTATILAVEDDQQLRNMLSDILRKRGHTVITAGNAREALPIGEHYEGQIDLLITDVVMPGMNGVELAEKLKAVRPDVAVVLISGYGDSELLRRGLTADNTELLLKPFGADKLLDTINRMLT